MRIILCYEPDGPTGRSSSEMINCGVIASEFHQMKNPVLVPIIFNFGMAVFPSRSDDSSEGTYLAIGDSITQGVPYVPAGYTYPDYFERMTGRRVINLGVGGLTVAEMEVGFGSAVAEHNPSIVLIMGGVNDIEYGRSSEDIIEDLSSMYGVANHKKITVVMCTLLPASLDAVSEEARVAVNEWIRGQTDEGRVLADVDIELSDRKRNDRLASEYDSGDGTHPNAEGMRRIAMVIQFALYQ